MGGLHLEVPDGRFPGGTVLQVTMSEELVGDYSNSTELLFPMRTGNIDYFLIWNSCFRCGPVIDTGAYGRWGIILIISLYGR